MLSTENLITQLEGQETLPMHELQGLDKQLRRIKGSIKMEMVKEAQVEEHIMRERRKLEEIRNIQDYTGMQCNEKKSGTASLILITT